MRPQPFTRIAALALAVVGGVIGAAFRPVAQPAWTPQVDAVFSAWNAPGSPGCALGVFANGRIAYERGYGMADLEHDVPIRPESVFYVGSLSKQFTAMAAALAIDAGTLGLDDSIRTYLPELPAYADAIKIRHLIHHTSGLRDYNTLLSVAGRRGDEAYDNRTVLAMTARQTALNFRPGDEYLYSNTGYTLLATVVERATRTPFATFAETRIFKPLDMAVTHFHVDSTRLVRGRAMAYARSASGETRLDTPSNERAGAGGVFTNVRDLVRWDENFYDARVGGRRVIDRLQTTEPLNDGKPSSYAWGLQLGTFRGLPIVEHGGSLGGYRAHLLRVPSEHTSVALLCNSSSIVPAGLARQVAEVVLGARLTAPAAPAATGGAGRGTAPPSPVAVNPSRLPEYAGEYYSPEIEAVFSIAIDGGRLTLRREADREAAVLQPIAEHVFRGAGLSIRFSGDRPASASLTVDAGRVRGIRFERRPPGSSGARPLGGVKTPVPGSRMASKPGF